MKYKLEKGKKKNIFKANKIKWKKRKRLGASTRFDGWHHFFWPSQFLASSSFFFKKKNRSISLRSSHRIFHFVVCDVCLVFLFVFRVPYSPVFLRAFLFMAIKKKKRKENYFLWKWNELFILVLGLLAVPWVAVARNWFDQVSFRREILLIWTR